MPSRNWYIVLDLEFDPPEEDEKKIEEKINEKNREWSRKSNDPLRGADYRALLSNVTQIKKDMLGEENKRKEIAAAACKEVYEPIDNLIKMIGRDGSISDNVGHGIAKQQNVSIDVVKKRAAALGFKWEENSVDYDAIYDKYYTKKPPKKDTFEGYDKQLSVLNCVDLYDFLFPGQENACKLPCNQLQQKTKEKRDAFVDRHDPVSTANSQLNNACVETFRNENTKAEYDTYLGWKNRTAIFKEFKVIAGLCDEITKEMADDYIEKLTKALNNDNKLANDVFVAFCKKEKIAYNASGSAANNPNIKICRCGCRNDVSDGRKFCRKCGLELEIKCPDCGAVNDSNVEYCSKCGFEFEKIDKAIALCESAEKAIDELNFDVAKAYLTDANNFWPNSTKVKDINKTLQEREKRVGKEVEAMRNAMKENKYVDADKRYKDIKKLFQNYSDANIEQEISQAISRAQALLNKAKTTKVEKDIFELCAQAYDICADLPGIKELMPAPPAVSNLSVNVNASTKTNILSWNSTEDRSVRYVVIRSINDWVQHPADGEEIFRGSASSYADKDIEAGTTYYYNVFAERAGNFSKAAKGETATNLFEISNVSISPGDSTLNITWDNLPQNATAEIYEISANGNKKQLATSSSNCYLVSGLKNGTTYSYYLSLAYVINGKKETTKGVSISGIPDCPPEPIDTLRVRPCKNNIFEATWFQDDPDADVRLYRSTQKPKHKIGDNVLLQDLEKEMQPLQQQPLSAEMKKNLVADEKGVSFKYEGAELLYIVAVVVKSGFAVFGSLSRASNGETVDIKSVRLENGKTNIYLKAPKDAIGFVVLYCFDRFPADIGDKGAVRKHITIKQYMEDSALRLDTAESKKYYFSVFAEFRRDGETDYSESSEYIFDNSPKENITYSITVNKKIFGNSYVTLEFESKNSDFELPDIDIMSAVGNTPMFRPDAEMFYSIPAQHVNGTLRVRIPLPEHLAKNTYIKPFLKDDMALSGSQLFIKEKSDWKIS